MAKRIAFIAIVALLASGLGAQASSSAISRADDGGLWHFEDNPALMAPGATWDRLMLGASFDGMDVSNPGSGNYSGTRVAWLLPFFGYYDLSLQGNAFDLTQGFGLPLSRSLGIGYDFTWSSAKAAIRSYEAGILVRPAGFLSIGLTGGLDATTGNYDGGAGLALRPLSFIDDSGNLARALTLDADISWDQAAGLSSADFGLRIKMADAGDLVLSYSPSIADYRVGDFGIELRIALGDSGISVSAPSIANAGSFPLSAASDIDVRLSEPARGGDSLGSSAFGRRVLVIKGIDEITPLPGQGRGFFSSLSPNRTMSFPELMALLERARREGSVEAVAFEKLPPLAGAADYEEFVAELARLRQAGKKIVSAY